jgi:hypothetical protein
VSRRELPRAHAAAVRPHSAPGLPVAAALALALAVTAGCAPALREPPPIEDLGRTRSSTRPAADVLAEAERLDAARTLPSVRRAAELWEEAAARFEGERVTALLEASRARVWLAVREPERKERLSAATSAIEAAQLCAAAAPGDPRCDYRLAVALGVQARERRTTALDALPHIMGLLERAAETDHGLDQGGPDRVLALLYLRAPGWPAGPGDPDLGLEHARRAVTIAPDHPPNQLALAEALDATGDAATARGARSRAAELARGAADRGDPDAAEWLEEAERVAR